MHFQGVFCTVAFATLASAAVAKQVPTPGSDKYTNERSNSSSNVAAREAALEPEPMPEPQPYADAAAWEAAHGGPRPSYAWTTDADTYPTSLATHAANWASQLSSLAASATPTAGVKNATRAVADAMGEGLPGASDEDEDYEFDEAWYQQFLDEHGKLAFDHEDSGANAPRLRARDAEPEADAPVDSSEGGYGDLYARDFPDAKDTSLGFETPENGNGDIYARGAEVDYSEEGYGDIYARNVPDAEDTSLGLDTPEEEYGGIYARDTDFDFSEEGYGDLYTRDIPDTEDTSLGLDTSEEGYSHIDARHADIDYPEEPYSEYDDDNQDETDDEDKSCAKRTADAIAEARNVFIAGKGIHSGLVRGAKHILNGRDMGNFESGEEYEDYFGQEDLEALDVEDYNEDEGDEVPDGDLEALYNDLSKRDVDDEERDVDVDLEELFNGVQECDVEDDVPDLDDDQVDNDALHEDPDLEARHVEEPGVDIDLAEVYGEAEEEEPELDARDPKIVEPIMRRMPINVGARQTVKFSTLTRDGTKPTEKKGWFW